MKKSKEILALEIIKKSLNLAPPSVQNKNKVLSKIPLQKLVKIGGLTKDEANAVVKLIDEFGLDDPKKLIKFIIDLHFAGIESINEGIYSIRRDLLTSEIKKIHAVIDKVDDMVADDNRRELLKKYSDEIISVISDLEGKIDNYISEIKEIDELPGYLFKLKAIFNKQKVTESIKMIKASLQAYLEALNIYVMLSNERDRSTVTGYIDKKRQYFEKIEWSLLIAYDKDKDYGFWDSQKKLSEIDDIKAISQTFGEYLIAEKGCEIDFENDVIFS